VAALTRTLLPRLCPSCHESHPPLTTCAGGWAPWNGEPVEVTLVKRRTPALVSLDPDELARADRYAEERVLNHEEVGSTDVAGLGLQDREARLALDLDGVLGEMAVARWLGFAYVHTKGAFKVPDVGPAYVRSTRHATGHLIVRPGDPAGPYVLVVDRRPAFRIAGWLPSEVARTFPLRKPDRSRPAAYLVPQPDLMDLPEGAAGVRALQGSR